MEHCAFGVYMYQELIGKIKNNKMTETASTKSLNCLIIPTLIYSLLPVLHRYSLIDSLYI